MSVPVLTFFNNKGGVGKTSLVYHVAWMMSELGKRVLVCDLDPQANLTSAFLSEEQLEYVWNPEKTAQDGKDEEGGTIFECLKPLMRTGDIKPAKAHEVSSTLGLIAGDLALSGFEDTLSEQWPKALGTEESYRPFRVLTAFWTIIQQAAREMNAEMVFVDVGPNLGAINRSALIASDFVVVPLAADLFSLQGLRNLGPKLDSWRKDWKRRLDTWETPEFPLPKGEMRPIGYVVQQYIARSGEPVRAYEKWVKRIPYEYTKAVENPDAGNGLSSPSDDPNCLATIKHYRSLVPMGQEARKPIFRLTPADGAIGGHANAAQDAWKDYKEFATIIADKVGL